MTCRVLAVLAILAVASPQEALAQPGSAEPGLSPAVATTERAPDGEAVIAPASTTQGSTFGAAVPAQPFAGLGRDFRRFFSEDTAKVLALFGPAAGVAHTWDRAGIRGSQAHLNEKYFAPGNIGGGFYVQAGAAAATWAVGRIANHDRLTVIGGDLVRAQIVSQAAVQATKFATRRERPDGSNRQSFPSGHTASAFATASVLDRHLGWKAGVPAYSFAGYVAVSRMSANRHHLSDVIMGAAVGVAAGRAVTWSVGRTAFDVGVAPTAGGAAVTFTRK